MIEKTSNVHKVINCFRLNSVQFNMKDLSESLQKVFSILIEVKEMDYILQRPFKEDQTFNEVIENKKSLVVFVRHPG
jgi:uncharacterized membrane protein